MRRRLVLMGTLTVFLLAASCGGDEGGGGGGGGGGAQGASVGATEKDFAIALNPSSTSAGDVTFDIRNDGPSVHEFVVFKTDLAQTKLPTTKENGAVIVDEEGKGIEPVDEVEDVQVGQQAKLSVTLQPGGYVVICNLPTHYQRGMHAALTVE